MDRKWKLVIILAILLFPIAVVVSVWLLYPPRPPSGLTVDRKIQLLREKSVALGYLEKNEYDKAIPFLETLVRELPNEPLGHRSLALALFKPSTMNPDSTLSKDEVDRLQRLLATVERMLALEGDQAYAQFLAGRVYAKQAELLAATERERLPEARAKAKACFEAAARLAVNDPAPLFDVYALEKRFGDDPEVVSLEALQALQGAQQRAPGNLACLVELLRVLMQRKSPAAQAVAERLFRLTPGDADTRFPNVHPRAGLEAIAAALAKQPTEPTPEAFGTLNLASSQLHKHFGFYQLDVARIRPHPLEFTLEDFQSSFYADLPIDAEPAIDVKFVEATPSRAAGASPLVAAQRDDLTLNGGWGVVMLSRSGGKTAIGVLPEDARAGIESLEVQGEFRDFQLADLDIDILPPLATNPKENIPADLDLILYGPRGIRLLENRAEGEKRRWVDRTSDCGLPALATIRWLLNCDVDHDGNLDLVVGLTQGIRLFRNRGAWAFEEITGRSAGLETLKTVAAGHGDFDRDGDLDLYLVHTDGGLSMLENQRGGRFEVRPAHEKLDGASSLSIVDVDNDGRLDCVVGYRLGAALLRAGKKGLREPTLDALALPGAATSRVLSLDYDNDGWTDILLLGDGIETRGARLFRNAGGKHFELQAVPLPQLMPAAQVTDLDEDGDLDLLYLDKGGQLKHLRNEGGNQNHWLKLRLRAEKNVDEAGQGQATKSNYRCIGGTSEIRAGRHYQLQQVTDTITHFGLGKRKHVDTIRAIWTNGVPQSAIKPRIDAVIEESQLVKGSCPYLYTWDGRRFVFVTDCLWSSGLGMKQTHGVDMPHDRQFNHLVIPGERLKPRDGRYVLQFTNELWEGPFLDQAQLWVVDHPAGVEVFTNQRVPPDARSEFKLITVSERRLPRAARDHKDRDVLDVVARRDHRCVGGFRRTRYVGLAERHWLELDLGNLSQVKAATLFLTGWIWPTDTSANIAISLDPRFAGPAGVIGGAEPPTLQVPDGKGGWVVADPMMGFPSGKMQTVAVPLPLDKFPTGDYRVRVATMMELYWDEAFVAVDSTPAAHELNRLEVLAADLHYRGYSRVLQERPDSPFVYDYQDVDRAPRWLPIPGRFVRYGSVTELLRDADSRYVSMSPGDEITLEFTAPPPPKPGWTRSFIFYANGWLKDFDLNASAGGEAGPYPFEGMTRYPYSSKELHPHEHFLKEYLLRTDDSDRFWDEVKGRR